MSKLGSWAALVAVLSLVAGCGEENTPTDGGMTTQDSATTNDASVPNDMGMVADMGQAVDHGNGLVDLGPEEDMSVSCECSPSDPCCDSNCQLRANTFPCSATLLYTCAGGEVCGATIQLNSTTRFCSGSSAQCDGAMMSGSPGSMACGSNRCVEATITDGDTSGFGTSFGCVPDGSC